MGVEKHFHQKLVTIIATFSQMQGPSGFILANAPAKLALQVQLSDEISSLDNFNEWYKNGQNNTFERKALDVVKPIYKVLWNDDSATYDNDNKLLQDIKLCSADKNIEGKESKPPN